MQKLKIITFVLFFFILTKSSFAILEVIGQKEMMAYVNKGKFPTLHT